ncbi:MAG: sulfatase [Candidatus Cryptobacteroides sp.]
MKNRYIAVGSMVSLAFANAFPSVAAKGESPGRNTRPNFIIIVADDMGYGDISCFGNTRIHTPNLDRMAAEGMLLTDFHSNGPVSSPTRCALLTGRYQQRAGIDGVLLTNVEKLRKAGLQPHETTFADVLSGNGYDVAMFGKWHLGYLPQYGPLNHGFGHFEGFLAGNVDYKAFLDSQGRPDWYEGGVQKTPEGYLTDLINDKAASYIASEHDRPFCLYVAHGCPHSPYQGPDDDAYRTVGSNKETGKPRKNLDDTYKDMIETMDEGIGRIFAALRETGLDRNTFVIFFSDNGPCGPGTAGALRGGKGDVFEGGHRVPAIVRMPGTVKKGAVSGETVLCMDIFPTMLDMAGIRYDDSGRPLDGISFLPVLKGKTLPERPLFWKYRVKKAVRMGDYKYVETVTGKKENRQTHRMLFNLKEDAGEQNNIIEEYPEKASKMKQLLQDWVKDVTSDTPEQTI